MYMWDLLHGDLGRSVVSNRPVVEDLIDFFPASLELTVFALLFATFVAVPIGVTASKKPNSRLDNGLRMVSSFFISMPDFWLGLAPHPLLLRHARMVPIHWSAELLHSPAAADHRLHDDRQFDCR